MSDSNPKIRVLHIAKWYPHDHDPMFGLFVRQHALASGLFCDASVLFVIGHEKEKQTRYQFDSKSGINELKIYFRLRKGAFNMIINNLIYFILLIRGFKRLNNQSKFDIIHVHILTRLGIFALGLKIFKGIPYIVTEHWSRYLTATNNFKGFFRKSLTKMVVAKAGLITTVTQNLTNAMISHGLKNENYHVLENIVNDAFSVDENKTIKRNAKKRFISVTCFEDRSKNLSGLINAIAKLEETRQDFELTLVGDGEDFNKIQDLAKNRLSNIELVRFTGMLEGEKLVSEFRNSDMLLVFSNYENMPVVINEAFRLGLPVISTNVGGIKEVVNPENGVLIDSGDELALCNKMKDFMDAKLSFDNTHIKEVYGKRYSPSIVGAKITGFYKQVLGKK